VGNIEKNKVRKTNWTVHPHVCGEHSIKWFNRSPRFGSSPRVWGTLISIETDGDFLRFIPTCVGNITFAYPVALFVAVHPHVCGEHDLVGHGITVNIGSSPRVWGTSFFLERLIELHRFIPTCVGNIMEIYGITPEKPVHPHVCGEHISIVILSLFIYFRFIPTCVGNILV